MSKVSVLEQASPGRPLRARGHLPLGQVMENALSAALSAAGAARVSYALGLHGRLSVTRHVVRLSAGLPLKRPLVMCFASDFHAGTTHPQLYVRLMNEVQRLQPDVLLLGGDYVSTQARRVAALLPFLACCNPPLGKYAVLGNHDLWSGDRHISQQLAAAGVQVLVNRNVALPAPFERVSICGIDDPWVGRVDGAGAFAGAGPIRILLSHSPDGLSLLRGVRFDVGFAGHTHGGQIAFPNGTPLVNTTGALSRRYSRGRFEIEGCGPLLVSRGVGCSIVPVRINSDPELIMCTLESAVT